MTLIIEDGTGVKGANSYVTLAAAKAAVRPAKPTNAEVEAVAVEAFGILDRLVWPGKRIGPAAWPRVLPGESLATKRGKQLPNWVKLAQLRIMQDIIEGGRVPTDWRHQYSATGEQVMPPGLDGGRLLQIISANLVRKRI